MQKWITPLCRVFFSVLFFSKMLPGSIFAWKKCCHFQKSRKKCCHAAFAKISSPLATKNCIFCWKSCYFHTFFGKFCQKLSLFERFFEKFLPLNVHTKHFLTFKMHFKNVHNLIYYGSIFENFGSIFAWKKCCHFKISSQKCCQAEKKPWLWVGC